MTQFIMMGIGCNPGKIGFYILDGLSPEVLYVPRHGFIIHNDPGVV